MTDHHLISAFNRQMLVRGQSTKQVPDQPQLHGETLPTGYKNFIIQDNSGVSYIVFVTCPYPPLDFGQRLSVFSLRANACECREVLYRQDRSHVEDVVAELSSFIFQ